MIDAASSPLAFFATEMARLRAAAGYSQPSLAKAISYSVSQVTKVETCQRIPQADLARKLDETLGTDLFQRLQPLVERSSVLPWFRDLFDVEGQAAQVSTYETYLIPGLLQAEAYARASVEATRPMLAPDEIEQAVALRMTRQEILELEDGPRIWAVMDESALRRKVGGPDVMREQLEHLMKVYQHPRVVIQVIPDDAGLGCAFGRAFTLLSFAHQPDMVYLEDFGSARYLREREEVVRYSLAFDYLRGCALSDLRSAEFIGAILHGS